MQEPDKVVAVREDGFMRLTARFRPRGVDAQPELPPVGEPVCVLRPGHDANGTTLDIVAVGTTPTALADLFEATADALRFGLAEVDEEDGR